MNLEDLLIELKAIRPGVRAFAFTTNDLSLMAYFDDLSPYIDAQTLNTVILNGPQQGLSIALMLAATQAGIAVLAANNYALASQINAQTLNTILRNGPHARNSLAYLLSRTKEGCAILAANNYALASQINAQTLNSIIQNGPDAGRSVAFWLACLFPGGIAVLAANNYALALQINAQTLNTIIQNGPNAGNSVALWLARFPEGIAVLAANNYALALQINAQTLNTIKQNDPNAGRSLAYLLSRTKEGCAILAAHNYALALQINAQTLNTIIKNGPDAGRSVALMLAGFTEGRTILAANNKYLSSLVSQTALDAIARLGTSNDERFMLTLLFTIATGNLSIAKVLISSAGNINSAPPNGLFTGQDPLSLAIERGDVEFIKLLIDKDAKFDIDFDPQTPRLAVTTEINELLTQIFNEFADCTSETIPENELTRIKNMASFARKLSAFYNISQPAEFISTLLAGHQSNGYARSMVYTDLTRSDVLECLNSPAPIIFKKLIDHLRIATPTIAVASEEKVTPGLENEPKIKKMRPM